MPTALARIAVRTLLLAVLLAAILPLIGTAQEADEPDEETPGEAPLIVPPPGLPGQVSPSPVPVAASPTPIPTPEPLPSRDWRKTGFASVVDGQLFDPYCRPLRSVGSNVPNLMFRQGLRENLEWMRQHQIRWMRVIGRHAGRRRAAPGRPAPRG
jgi:hypothetical protein